MRNSKNERLRDLAARIAIEHDQDTFTALIKELNQLLDDDDHPSSGRIALGQRLAHSGKPPSKTPSRH